MTPAQVRLLIWAFVLAMFFLIILGVAGYQNWHLWEP